MVTVSILNKQLAAIWELNGHLFRKLKYPCVLEWIIMTKCIKSVKEKNVLANANITAGKNAQYL